jgi:hypothetical protein
LEGSLIPPPPRSPQQEVHAGAFVDLSRDQGGRLFVSGAFLVSRGKSSYNNTSSYNLLLFCLSATIYSLSFHPSLSTPAFLRRPRRSATRLVRKAKRAALVCSHIYPVRSLMPRAVSICQRSSRGQRPELPGVACEAGRDVNDETGEQCRESRPTWIPESQTD